MSHQYIIFYDEMSYNSINIIEESDNQPHGGAVSNEEEALDAFDVALLLNHMDAEDDYQALPTAPQPFYRPVPDFTPEMEVEINIRRRISVARRL